MHQEVHFSPLSLVKQSYPCFSDNSKSIKKDTTTLSNYFKFSSKSHVSQRRLMLFGKPVKTDEEQAMAEVAQSLPRPYMKGSWLERKLFN